MFDFQLDHTKDFKKYICCFSCFNVQHFRVAQAADDKETVNGLYVNESKN